MVQMQMQQAADAKAANEARTARLEAGTKQINELFSGRPVTQRLDLSSVRSPPPPPPPVTSPAASPAVDPYTGASVPAAAAAAAAPAAAPAAPTRTALSGGYTWGETQASDSPNVQQKYGLYDPSGGLVTSRATPEELSQFDIETPTGDTTGGFGQDFYDKFRQSIMGYYQPQEQEQYKDARSKLAYSLARAGSLNSSVAAMDVGKLSEQDQLNRAQIASQADTQTAGLRSQVQQDQQSALNQLYSTEDPTIAANTAQNMVANASLTKPLLNPAGALFAPIIAGVGNAISGFTNPYAYISQNQPNTASPDKSTGIQGQG